jgi:DNA repair exonuclease SbcCD nuclease subunit
MKVAIICDTHFGVKKSNNIFLKSQLRFFEELFFPYLREHDIKTIFHLGDWFDNRTSINLNVLNEVDNLIVEEFSDFETYILVGNHDSYFKSTIDIHSLKIFRHLPYIEVVDDIGKLQLNGRDILLVPWRVDNHKFTKKVSDKNFWCDLCLGHFEINSFSLNNNKVCDFGLSPDLFFNNYTITFSGHFHKRKLMERDGKKIQYIGNPYQLTRADINEPRGFCILDLDTLEYEFIDNDLSIKYKQYKFPDEFDAKDIQGNVVDIIVDISQGYNEKEFQEYVTEISSHNPAFSPEIKIENNVDMSVKKDYKIQTVRELIHEYVYDLDSLTDNDKKIVTDTLIGLYDKNKNA